MAKVGRGLVFEILVHEALATQDFDKFGGEGFAALTWVSDFREHLSEIILAVLLDEFLVFGVSLLVGVQARDVGGRVVVVDLRVGDGILWETLGETGSAAGCPMVRVMRGKTP